MHTIIVTDNLKQASFIQKGLQYESLTADLITMAELDAMEEILVGIDGVFINLDPHKNQIDEIVGAIRNYKKNIPIILLGSEQNIIYEHLLVNKDVQSIFIRPFPFRNVASDMRYNIFEVKENFDVGNYILRDLELDISAHQVKHKDRQIYLRNKEFELLHFLMANKGKVLNRNTILENVWDRNASILTNTVDVHVSNLRKKIEKQTEQKFIHTVHCTGYLFQ